MYQTNSFYSGVRETAEFSLSGFCRFYRIPLLAASELNYNIYNANLDKNKKQLFLYFDTCHRNQTFFSYIININENLMMRRNVALNTSRATYLDQTQAIM